MAVRKPKAKKKQIEDKKKRGRPYKPEGATRREKIAEGVLKTTNIIISAEDMELIDRAYQLLGVSKKDFIANAAVEKAKRVISKYD